MRLVNHWRRRYTLCGLLLALGAPAGLSLVRLIETHGWGLSWLAAELTANAVTYAYLTMSTTLVFSALGWHLGHKEDLLEQLSVTDPLTGIANRRAFDHRLGEELSRARRYKTPLSLLLVDLDRLKSINDSGGHAAGDRAIRSVVTSITAASRRADFVARLGGDEFAILAPQTHLDNALRLAERMHKNLLDIPTLPDPLTVSIGVAESTMVGSPRAEDLIATADAALYGAKAAGRNRTVAISNAILARRDPNKRLHKRMSYPMDVTLW